MVVCPPFKVGSLVAASFGTEGNGPWPALLREFGDRLKYTSLRHEKAAKELQEARAETQTAQAETQKIKAELQEAQAELVEHKQQMMQAKTQIESLEAALSDERKRYRKKSKTVREMNLLA
jgi:chromosome segregation ATPase